MGQSPSMGLRFEEASSPSAELLLESEEAEECDGAVAKMVWSSVVRRASWYWRVAGALSTLWRTWGVGYQYAGIVDR